MPSTQPFGDISDEPLLNIKAVSQATGVEPVTLRAWERRYGIPVPSRSEQGYRLYSERDVAILRWLKSKVDAGVKIRQAVDMLHTQAPQALPQSAPLSLRTAEGSSLEALRGEMLAGAYAFDAARVQSCMAEAFALFPVEDVCLNMLIPVLNQIGHEWRIGRASLQVEHFLTNLVRQQLLTLDAAAPQPTRRGRVLTGSGPGDLHEMGVLTLSILLRRRGWEVIYLGQVVGLARLRTTVESTRPDVVMLSASTLSTVRALRDAAEVVAGANRSRTQFIFGGPLFPYVPDLATRIPGIYGGDTLLEALQRLDGLLSGSWQPAANQPPEIDSRVRRAHDAVQRAARPLTEHIAVMLEELDPGLEGAAALDAAGEAVDGLVAALGLDLPELLEVPGSLAGPPLHERGVDADALYGLLEYFVGVENMPAVGDFLPYL